jgi:surfactin synthase thioesterase subunit
VSNEKTPGEEEVTDIFQEDTTDIVHTILLMRIYDMVTAIARKVNPRDADIIFEGHSLGKIFGPAPSFDMSDEDV